MGDLTALVLDPDEVSVGRAELAINEGSIRVGQDGPDWGDAAIQAYMAEAARGERPVDYRLPNRQIKVPLLLGADGPDGFEAARRSLQAKVGRIQQEGGWLRRDSTTGRTNPIANPSFETGLDGWQSDTGIFTNATDWAYTGSRSAYFRGQASGQNVRVTNAAAVAVAPGETWTAQFRANVASGGVNRPVIYWWADDDTFISTTNGTPDSGLDGERQLTVTGTAPATAAKATPGIAWVSGNAQLRFDAVMFELGSTASGYFDGDTPGCQWESAPHASPSIEGVRLYADLVNATLSLPDRYGHLGVEADVVLTLDALPDFYGDEVQLEDHSETSLPELTFTSDVRGDYPARLRVVVDNDSAADQLGMLAAVRSRHYSDAATARLAYEAAALTPLDTAALTTLTGASGSGSNTIRHGNLAASWTPVMNTNLIDGSFLTHEGSYRVWARVYTTSPTPPALRFVWDVGDLVFPEENAPVQIPAAANFYMVDLGEVRLDAVPAGAHRWQGQTQGRGAAGGENVSIDRLWLVPIDEGAVKLRAPGSGIDGLTNFAARDALTDIADGAALSGATADAGGTWATSGAATDFAGALEGSM